MIHPTAAAGFGADAERYDRGRPGYPAAIVARIARLADGPVLDLAAGTGKLTRALSARHLAVTAVEPVPAMREVLAARGGARHVVGGVAEQLPFADGSYSLVTVAQAFHWFDTDRAWGELARVVRSGGHVAVLWNARERHTRWQSRLWELMDELERDAPWRERPIHPVTVEAPPGWDSLDRVEQVHDVPTTVELLEDRLASVSAVAVLPPDELAGVLATVRDIAASAEQPLMLRYRTRLFVYARAAGAGTPQ